MKPHRTPSQANLTKGFTQVLVSYLFAVGECVKDTFTATFMRFRAVAIIPYKQLRAKQVVRKRCFHEGLSEKAHI